MKLLPKKKATRPDRPIKERTEEADGNCHWCGKPISVVSIKLCAKKRRDRNLVPMPLKYCGWECKGLGSRWEYRDLIGEE